MDVVNKPDETTIEVSSSGAALDGWPPPRMAPMLSISDEQKENSSRLLFLVEYIGEQGESATYINGSEQYLCAIDHQVVNQLDSNCVSDYPQVQFPLSNAVDQSADRQTVTGYQTAVAKENSVKIETSSNNVSTVISNCPAPNSMENNFKNCIVINANNCENNFNVSTTSISPLSRQSPISPLSAPHDIAATPISAIMTRSPGSEEDRSNAILVENNRFALSQIENNASNYSIREVGSGVSHNLDLTGSGNTDRIASEKPVFDQSYDDSDKKNLYNFNSNDKKVASLENRIAQSQIPREYLMTAKVILPDDHSNDDAFLRNLINTIKNQELTLNSNNENGEVRLVSFLEMDQENELDDLNLINETMAIDEEGQNSQILPDLANSPENEAQDKDMTLKTYWAGSEIADNDQMQSVDKFIKNKPSVLSRARASLPSSYLSLNLLQPENHNKYQVYGVYACKTIPVRSQFGPIEGVLSKCNDLDLVAAQGQLNFLIEGENGEMHRLDVSNENTTNWMRFVRPATNTKEQNLILFQQGNSLYFTSIKTIQPRQELLVWYSRNYAIKRNLQQHLSDVESNDNEKFWPCFQCEEKFKSSEELQKHLNVHNSERVDKNVAIKAKSPKRSFTNQNIWRKSQNVYAPSDKYKKNNSKTDEPKKFQTYECTICSKKFPKMYRLKRHMQMHNSSKRYCCIHCSLVFTHPYNRDRHVRTQHINKFSSMTMNKVIPDSSKYDSFNDANWLCNKCNLTFSSASVLNLHTLAHAVDNLEENKSIDNFLSSNNSIDLTCDSEVLENSSNNQCPQCTKGFESKRKLIEHVSMHGQKRIDVSTQCGNMKNEKSAIDEGLTNENELVKSKNVNTSSVPDKRRCNVCCKVFNTIEQLMKHSQEHSAGEVRDFPCEICENRFRSQATLDAHKKSHLAKKSFECPICNIVFQQILALKTHIRTHEKNGKFTCPHCKKIFDMYSLVRKHIRSFHCARKLVCVFCGKLFNTQDKLRLHLLRHSDHREFLCNSCGKQFKRKDKLTEHMKRVHTSEQDKSQQKKKQSNPKKTSTNQVLIDNFYGKFLYKCDICSLGFKRRGMLINHMNSRHPDISLDSIPELNMPILKTTRDYYCQYCEKIYKSSSKRKAHILKNHPGLELPMSSRQKGSAENMNGLPNPTFSQLVGSITTEPHGCQWCHKQYASKAKLLQHQRKKHLHLLPFDQQQPRLVKSSKNSSVDEDEDDCKSSSPLNGPQEEYILPNTLEICNKIQSSTNIITNTCEKGKSVMHSSVENIDYCSNVKTVESIATTASQEAPSKITVPTNITSISNGQIYTIHPSTNGNVITDTYLSEYEIATADMGINGMAGIIIDAATLKRDIKSVGSDSVPVNAALLMSEFGCSLSDLQSMTSSSNDQQYLKLIQMPVSSGIVLSETVDDPYYTAYTAR